MKYSLVALYDKKLKTYMSPFAMPNAEYACVSFQRAVSSGEVKNARDMSLYLLGTFDDKTGIITSDVEHLMDAIGEVSDDEG